MKRILDTTRSTPFYNAVCHDCAWSDESEGKPAAQANARDHVYRTGHAVSSETVVTYTYRYPDQEGS